MGLIGFITGGQRIESRADNTILNNDNDRNGRIEYSADHPRSSTDRELFQRADTNDDGSVTHSELVKELRKYDTNGDGRLSFIRETTAMEKDLNRGIGERG